MPSSTPYDGRITDVSDFLINKRPKKWLEELAKLQSMTSESGDHRLIKQQEFQV